MIWRPKFTTLVQKHHRQNRLRRALAATNYWLHGETGRGQLCAKERPGCL